jgi:hypothetical protein
MAATPRTNYRSGRSALLVLLGQFQLERWSDVIGLMPVTAADDEFELPVREANDQCCGMTEPRQQRGNPAGDRVDVLGGVGALGYVDVDLR